MARQALTIAGTIVGSAFGMPQLGFALGSLIGNAVDPVQIQGPKIGELQVQTSRDGVPRPVIYGVACVSGNIIDRSEPKIVKKKERQGKGGPEVVTERVYQSFAIRICEGEIQGISRVWENEKLIYDGGDTENFPVPDTGLGKFIGGALVNLKGRIGAAIYFGGEDQLPDPTFEAIHGIGNTPAYRGTAYIVFKDKDLTDFGGAIPQYRFEVNGPVLFQKTVFFGLADAGGGNGYLRAYEISGGSLTQIATTGLIPATGISELGDGYIAAGGNLYQWDGSAIVFVGSVPYGGTAVERTGNNVLELVVTANTTTTFDMARKTYELSGTLLSTDTFSIPKLDGSSNCELRRFQNSARFTQMRRNAAGSVDVSGWFDSGSLIDRPIYSPVGSSTYYSAWSPVNSNVPSVSANGRFYALGGSTATWLAVWDESGGSPVAFYSLSTTTDVQAGYCSDSNGNIWLSIPSENKLIKMDSSLNVIVEYSGSIPTNINISAVVY